MPDDTRGDGRFLPASRRWTNRPSFFRACLARARQAVRFPGLWTAVDMWTSCALFDVGGSGALLPPTAAHRVIGEAQRTLAARTVSRMRRANMGPRVASPTE